MTLADFDHALFIDLLTLALRGGWEAYQPPLAPDVEAGCSVVLMWITIGEKYHGTE